MLRVHGHHRCNFVLAQLKYLHYKTQCPTCSEETYEKDLRKNKILDEIIEQYLNVKEELEKTFRAEKTPTARDKNSRAECWPNSDEYEKKQVASNTDEMLNKVSDSPVLGGGTSLGVPTPCGRKDHQQDASTPSTSADLKIPSMFTPKSRKGFRNEENCQVVTCPVCRVDVPQSNINKHLDDCLKRDHARAQPENDKPKRKPLPKLVLSLMKDNVIRKKLKELGLSSQGDRRALESRLQKYTVLYNAECDKARPRPVPELIKQCEEEESLEKKLQKPSNRLNVNRHTEHNVLEQQRKKYLADNKDSFNHLIARIKMHTDSPRKLPVRRNILSGKNPGVPYKNCVASNSPTSEKSDFLSFESGNSRVDDSDSNASCSLQTYSSEHPTNFLTVELSCSSNDSDQCASNDSSSRSREASPLSYDTVVKTEIMETDESVEATLMHAKMTSSYWPSERDVSEDRLADEKESIREFIGSESENREKIALSAKRRKHGATYSPERHVTRSESEGRRQNDSRDEDSIVENGDDDIRGDYERSRREQLHVNPKEKYESGGTKFEKENLDSLDENKKVCGFRKREREMTIVLSDDEKNGNRSTSIRKSARLGLSEAKGFNNGRFGEDTRNEEEKPQSGKGRLRATRSKNPRGSVKETVKLKNGVSKRMKKITT
ncbi:E3 ubiquitin-protein ligase RAD18 isoform X2 [Ooceraea biroi]|uniref:RING-type E3 ubiquitin transferase n=1 Tax=Ooceraea biroi TaxID=2015173 RepID=A0A026WZ01_OOCBI|nr:E3 ubiquitin-protein ligase RAD18 isoform X2 [Ooceraea biroi]EZA61048.1 E3 ubiquitin-protein ligase RAD18 [Ooceraea biroi]